MQLNNRLGQESGFNAAFSFSVESLSDRGVRTDDLAPPLPRGDLVLRRSRYDKPTRADNAVLELILSAYAAHHKFGPTIHACWMDFESNRDPRLPLGGSYVNVKYISEQWTGDLKTPLSTKLMEADEFARAFAALLKQSVEHGFWQGDSKPGNVLYRFTGHPRKLQLCWTDFDGQYCDVFSKRLNVEIALCSVLAHAASFMGYVSCKMGEAVFRHYQPALLQVLTQEFGVGKITERDMCDWLDQFEHRAHSYDDDALEEAKIIVSRNLLAQMRFYVTPSSTDGPSDQRCILETKLRKPTFLQMLYFSLTRAGAPQQEGWARVNKAVGNALSKRQKTHVAAQ